MFWGSQSQGSDSGRLEMKQKQKPFASKSQGSDSGRVGDEAKAFCVKESGE